MALSPPAASLSPTYSALLHVPADTGAGRALLGAGPLPTWGQVAGATEKVATSRWPKTLDGLFVPAEWLEGREPERLAAHVATLKGLGQAVQERWEEEGQEPVGSVKGQQHWKKMPYGEQLVKALVTEGMAPDLCRSFVAAAVLCVLLEVVLRRVWLDLGIDGESVPALLRDLLLCPALAERLPAGLCLSLRVVFLPSGLNLRNLLLHGFLAPQEFPREFFFLIMAFVESLSTCLSERPLEDSQDDASARASTTWAMELPAELDRLVQGWLSTPPEADEWLSRAASFVPPGHAGLAEWSLCQVRTGRTLLGVLSLLLVLEHGLRLEFCRVNGAPEYALAQHGSYYSTLDGFGQRSKHQLLLGPSVESDGRENRLLRELGVELVHLVSDLFLQEGGPGVRAAIVHGRTRNFGDIFGSIPMARPYAGVILVFLALCVRSVEDASLRFPVLGEIESFLRGRLPYSTVYHPDARLAVVVADAHTAVAELSAMLAERLPLRKLKENGGQNPMQAELTQPSRDGGSQVLLEPGQRTACRFHCDASAIRMDKGSVASLAAEARAALRRMDIAAFGGTLPFNLLEEEDARADGAVAAAQQSTASKACDLQPHDAGWLRRLRCPGLESLNRSTPLFPLIKSLVEVTGRLAGALAMRIGKTEAAILDRSARTRQRRLFAATLLTGPAFVEYLAAVMLLVQRHVCCALAGGSGEPEQVLSRVARATDALATMGDEDNNRKGYDVGLAELCSFLKTRGAKSAFTCGAKPVT